MPSLTPSTKTTGPSTLGPPRSKPNNITYHSPSSTNGSTPIVAYSQSHEGGDSTRSSDGTFSLDGFGKFLPTLAKTLKPQNSTETEMHATATRGDLGPTTVQFSTVPATTSSYNPISTLIASDTNVLPIIVVGATASFSEAQDTDRASITNTITVSTTLTASEAGKVEKTVLPIIIGPGGFYWRPLPGPNLRFPSIPPLPNPPIPKLGCFKLGGIFAINCPPGSSHGKIHIPPVPENNGPKPDHQPPQTHQPDATNKPSSPSTTNKPSTTASTASTTTSSTETCTAGTPMVSGRISRRSGDDDSCAPPSATYIIYPKVGTDKGETDIIAATLRSFIKDETLIYTSSTKTFGINFWIAPLTIDQIKTLKETGKVASVNTEKELSQPNPLTSITSQDGVEEDLSFVSQRRPSDASRVVTPNRIPPEMKYFYDESAGEDIEVYVVDTGAKRDHEEFTQGENIANKMRWIHVGLDYDGQTHQDDSSTPAPGFTLPMGAQSPKSHGTCMLSRVGGFKNGVAKKVSPVVVRVPRRHQFGGGARITDYLEGVSTVLDDVGTQGKRAILLMAFYYPRINPITNLPLFRDFEGRDDSDGFRIRLRDLLRELIRRGVYPVTGAGNGGKSSVDGWPAAFGKPNTNDYVPGLIVVGAVTNSGEKLALTNTDTAGLPHVWAPGYQVNCAAAVELEAPYRHGSGTSQGMIKLPSYKVNRFSLTFLFAKKASAITAGLAAYFLKLSQIKKKIDVSTPEKMKHYILDKAWERQDGLKAIYNGAKPPIDLSCRPQRDLSGDGHCSIISANDKIKVTSTFPTEPKGPDEIERPTELMSAEGTVPATLTMSSAVETDSTPEMKSLSETELAEPKTALSTAMKPSIKEDLASRTTFATITDPPSETTPINQTTPATDNEISKPMPTTTPSTATQIKEWCKYVEAGKGGDTALCNGAYCDCSGAPATPVTEGFIFWRVTHCRYDKQPKITGCPTPSKTTSPTVAYNTGTCTINVR
ncbi:hypothetical protein FQN50_004571 [Emmonsiellopsis sp. PD_5]|nr:hypothetical protein FQN50_004571 [Emmonsiellopsis sp. PD_5]